jgi:predicted esterase
VYEFSNYTVMRQKIGELFAQNEFAEAAQILKWGLEEFPENRMANTYNLATCYAFMQEPQKAVETLQHGLDQGLWYGVWDFEAEFWGAVKELESFQEIQVRSKAAQQAAQETARSELEVVTPQDYDPEKKYPLFIALHGGGENIANFKPQWTSPRLESEFIVAYPQCSRVISMNGFCWMGEPQDREEIIDAYQHILAEYAIDTDRIIMGGFSAGGHQTLTLLLEEDEPIPVRGFIALCPPIPDEYPPEALARIKARGQRGLLLTTEMDGRVEAQRQFATAFEEAKIPLEFTINPNIGHWYPPDLGQKIDEAIDFILK